jgi:Apea-like HEPN
LSDRVIQLLTEIATATQQYVAQFQYPRIMTSSYRPSRPMIDELTKALSDVPEIAMWEKKQISTFNMIMELHLGFLAGSMVERIVEGVTPCVVYNDLMDLLVKRVARINVVSGVAGIVVPEVLKLGEGVKLLPSSMLPPTKMREDMFDLGRDGSPQFRSSVVMERPPQIALVIDATMTVVGSDYDISERKTVVEEVFLKQERALSALTLSGKDCAPFIVFSSSWIDHPAYSYSGFGGAGYGRYHGISPNKRGEVDFTLAKAVYGRLPELKVSDWPAIRGATERLSRSRSHVSEADRAIDLGIAIEMTLLHELQDDRGELKYRTALRGSWLLGKTGPERRSIFNAVRAAYDARSVAVHSGKLTKSQLIENLPVADDICESALRKIVDLGGFPPNWEALVLDQANEAESD